MALWVGCSSVLAGCDGEKPPIIPTVPSTKITDTGTGPIRDDEGSLVAMQWLPSATGPDEGVVVLGMFVESRREILNLAQCLGAPDAFCARALPESPGEFVEGEDIVAFDDTLTSGLTSREVGSSIEFGPWTANYGFDSARDLGFYIGTGFGPELPGGEIGVTLGGVWGDYSSDSDIEVPTEILVTSPDPSSSVDFIAGELIRLGWQSGGVGDIYLYVEAGNFRRLYMLEDTGSFDLDLSALSLGEGDPVELILGRWTRATIEHDGHEIEAQIQSNQPIRGVWRDIGTRVELTEVYDECSEAQSAPSVAPGNYYGSLEGFGSDLNPGAGGCTGFGAGGLDALVPIDLFPQDLLTVNYQLLEDDASLYLLTDCGDVDSCVDGSDLTLGGGLETASWLNETSSVVRVYIVLDVVGSVTDRYNLDIYVESLGGDVLLETCVDAIGQGPIETGTYRGSLAGHANLIDPACATPAQGGEGMLEVYLDPFETLTASVNAPGGDPKLYLLYNCAIGDSCFEDADNSGNANESIQYTNSTGFGEYFFLVVDSELNLGDYVLEVEIQ